MTNEIFKLVQSPDIETKYMAYCMLIAELGETDPGPMTLCKYDTTRLNIPLWAVRLAKHNPYSYAYKVFTEYSFKWIDRNYNETYAL